MKSLRWKITLAMASLALVATAAMGAISYRSTSARLVDEVDKSLVDASVLLIAQADRGRGTGQNRGILETYSVRILDRQARVANSSFDAQVPVSAAAAALVNTRGDRFDTVNVDGQRFRVRTIGLDVGGVQVARSLAETDRILDDVRGRTGLLVGLVSLLAALIGWMLAGTVAAPLRRLTHAAELVESSGDLDVDLPDPTRDEVGRLGAAFGSMLRALQRSRSEQQRLVQDAGHELRTPLTSLRTNLSVMRRHPDMADEMRTTIIDDLAGEVTELTDLVNELVSVASGELADQPPEDIDLGATVRLVSARVARRIDRAIVVEAAGAGIVAAPPAGLERAINNLLQNAAKFDPSGGQIDVSVLGGTLIVNDRGPGIPVEDLDLVFDRFHRADASRSLPGSGLGLSIVRDVVERHGGSVSAANRTDGGASIGFTLPLVAP